MENDSKLTLDILTPQGYLTDVQNNPNLDVMMNLFKIPRAFAVSGFGDWSVGQHSVCVAFLALYWSQFKEYSEDIRNRLMVLALTHDLHESATGDILPGLKTPDLRDRLDTVQANFLKALTIEPDERLQVDLKILDIIAFMYEIHQAQTLNTHQEKLLSEFFNKQKRLLESYCAKHGVVGIQQFMDNLGVLNS